MEIRINDLSDRELLENVFYQNLLINKKLNALMLTNEEFSNKFDRNEEFDFQNTTEEQILKTILSYKEDKGLLNENDIVMYKKKFDKSPS